MQQPGSYLAFSFLSDHWRPLRPPKIFQNETSKNAATSNQSASFGSSGVALCWRPLVRFNRLEQTAKQHRAGLSIWAESFFFFLRSLYLHFRFTFSFNASVFTLLFDRPFFSSSLQQLHEFLIYGGLVNTGVSLKKKRESDFIFKIQF